MCAIMETADKVRQRWLPLTSPFFAQGLYVETFFLILELKNELSLDEG